MSGQDAPPRPAAPPTSEASFPASAMDFLDKDDNPFVVQRDLILSQSVAAGFAASTPPGQTPTTESGGGGGTRADWLSWQSTETTSTTNSSLWRSVGGSGSTVRGWGEIAAGTGGRFASLRTSMSAGSMKSPWSSREWSTKPEPKNHSPAASVTISTEQANLEQRQRSQTQQKVELLPMSFFDVSSSDDDDDGSDGSGDDGGGSVASAPPNIAEGKNAHNFRRVGNGTRTGVVGVTSDADTDIDDDDHDVRSSLPRPSSDGGWPETKRCTPPNLKFRSRSRSRSSPPSEKRTVGVDRKGKASTTALARAPGNTNRRTFHANGVHSATGGNRHSPTAPMGNDGGGGGNGDRNTSSGSSSDSMFDIDHRETNADRTTTESRISRIKTGLKRGRTPPVRSPGDDRSYYSSDNGNNDSTVDGVDNADAGGGGSMFRGGKTGRNERYPAPVPRRPRSSSLSLSPSRFTAFDGDCNSADDTPSAVASLSPKSAAGGRNGNDSYLASSRRRRRRRSSRSRETVAGRRGVKRGLEEENLHDGIEAMRVASDDELSSVRSNAGGIGGVRRGKERMGGAVERGDRAAAWSANCEDQEEEHSEDDDYLDDEDLKPNISNPTWLGPFETYDLGAGESINPSINRYLKEYQREGVKWLYGKFAEGKGAVLGDDMGLGKTVQTISLISAVLHKTGTVRDRENLRRRRKEGRPASASGMPMLIVAPKAVVDGWMEHLEQWGFFEAASLTKSEQANGVVKSLVSGRLEILVVGYTMLGIVIDKLKSVPFDAVFFDEYHTIKSGATKQAQAASSLDTKRVYGLTGTLMQNKMDELWFLMHLIDPHCLGEQSRFNEHFTEPLKRDRAVNASAADRRLATKRQAELKKIIDRHMLRRTKEEVLSDVLKGKSDTVVFCNVSDVQRDLYLNVLALPEFQLLKRAKEPCDCGRRNAHRGRCCYKIPVDRRPDSCTAAPHALTTTTAAWSSSPAAATAAAVVYGGGAGGDGIDPRAVLYRKYHQPDLEECSKCPSCFGLAAVAKLQKIANHPCLLQVNALDSEEKRQDQLRFAEVAFTDKAREAMGGLVRSQKFLQTSKTEVCGKMKSLERLLESFYSARAKVLVFSWSTAMLDVLESFVGSKGYTYCRLDGSTSHRDRQSRIKEFNSDLKGIFVFLISTKAGGQGLNLHSASKVVLYDVNWNPALELQAQDRAYRIGQTKKVAVFRLLCQGTIEEVCYMRQIYKLQITSAAMGDQARGGRRQFNAVQGSKGQEGELFGIPNLLKFSDESLLKALRNKHNATATAAAANTNLSGSAGADAPPGSSSSKSGGDSDKGSGSIAGVETADEGELMITVQEIVEHATKTIQGGKSNGGDTEERQQGEEKSSDDAELAGLLGVLGLDAYTHDQLVAKDEDEGEEKFSQEASMSELTLSPLPHGGSRNAFEHTTRRKGVITHKGQHRGGAGGSKDDRRPIPSDRKSASYAGSRGITETSSSSSSSSGGGGGRGTAASPRAVVVGRVSPVIDSSSTPEDRAEVMRTGRGGDGGGLQARAIGIAGTTSPLPLAPVKAASRRGSSSGCGGLIPSVSGGRGSAAWQISPLRLAPSAQTTSARGSGSGMEPGASADWGAGGAWPVSEFQESRRRQWQAETGAAGGGTEGTGRRAGVAATAATAVAVGGGGGSSMVLPVDLPGADGSGGGGVDVVVSSVVPPLLLQQERVNKRRNLGWGNAAGRAAGRGGTEGGQWAGGRGAKKDVRLFMPSYGSGSGNDGGRGGGGGGGGSKT